jgi:hypothetical protein
MKNDSTMARVEINGGRVKTERFTDFLPDLPFGLMRDDMVSKQQVDWFFEEHCFPEHKADLKDQLEAVGLETYDAFEICKRTEGRMAGTPMWIRFLY